MQAITYNAIWLLGHTWTPSCLVMKGGFSFYYCPSEREAGLKDLVERYALLVDTGIRILLDPKHKEEFAERLPILRRLSLQKRLFDPLERPFRFDV